MGEPQDLRVAVTLLNPGGGLIKDPTNDALVVAGLIFDETTADSEDGCWSTCDLLPNYDSSAAGGALVPNTTGYRIQVIWGRTTVIDETIQIDAAGDYVLDNIDGADCVNICTILGETPELPPPPSFCEAVLACVPAETVTTLVNNGDGTYTYFNETGAQETIDICAAVNAFCPETLTTLVDNGDGSYTYTNEDGVVTDIAAPLPSTLTNNADGTWTHTADGISTIISSTSTDAGNVATVGTDGGTLITADDICGAVNANCPATVVTNADGTITITGTDDSTATTSLPTVNTDTFMLAVETTPGVFDFTNADGTTGVTIDVNELIVSADANNIVTVGADGGAFVDCETIQDCVGTALAAVDGIVYDDAGNSITVTIVDSNGVPLVPNADGTYQLPAAAAGGTTSSVTDNGDGTFTHDDGAGNTVVWDVNSSTVTDNGDGTFTHDDGTGTTVTWGAGGSADVGQAVVADNGDNTITVTGTDTAGVVTTGTAISEITKVAADGTQTVFDPAADCVPEGAFQSIVDHHTTTLTAAGCDGNPLELHRSLVIGDDHVAGATGVGGAEFIGVSAVDSSDASAALAGITTHHTTAVIASTNGTIDPGLNDAVVVGTQEATVTAQEAGAYSSRTVQSTGPRSVNIASIRSSAAGTQGFNAATDTATADGVNSANIASGLVNATGASAGNYSSSNANATGIRAVNIASVNALASGPQSANIASNSQAAVVTASGDSSVNIASDSSLASANKSANIATTNSTTQGANQTVNIASNDSTAEGVFAGNYSGGGNRASGPRSVTVGSFDSVAELGDSAGVYSSTDSIAQGNNSAVIASQLGSAIDNQSIAISGGTANVGQDQTFAHGQPGQAINNVRAVTCVGFRGATPQPARAVTTLADVILALQEQGLAI